jgi:hypothetical protein
LLRSLIQSNFSFYGIIRIQSATKETNAAIASFLETLLPKILSTIKEKIITPPVTIGYCKDESTPFARAKYRIRFANVLSVALAAMQETDTFGFEREIFFPFKSITAIIATAKIVVVALSNALYDVSETLFAPFW